MDTDYLKRTVADALTQGLAAVVASEADDPVERLGEFLVKYVENAKRDEVVSGACWHERVVVATVAAVV